jgi:hypothetical protein
MSNQASTAPMSAPVPNGVATGGVEPSEKELAIRAAIKASCPDKHATGGIWSGYIDQVTLNCAIEMGATEEEVKARVDQRLTVDDVLERARHLKWCPIVL